GPARAAGAPVVVARGAAVEEQRGLARGALRERPVGVPGHVEDGALLDVQPDDAGEAALAAHVQVDPPARTVPVLHLHGGRARAPHAWGPRPRARGGTPPRGGR